MVKSMSLAAKVPHFHYLEEIKCDALIELKALFQKENKDQNIKHTFLPFLIKSLSMALSKYPLLNSSFIEETNEVIFKGMQSLSLAFFSCLHHPGNESLGDSTVVVWKFLEEDILAFSHFEF
jgi:2-oxoisovalerate dehydrogenase E2 component (dihydrolipoyl transacylase)